MALPRPRQCVCALLPARARVRLLSQIKNKKELEKKSAPLECALSSTRADTRAPLHPEPPPAPPFFSFTLPPRARAFEEVWLDTAEAADKDEAKFPKWKVDRWVLAGNRRALDSKYI
eukprot:1187816-Prorocentrum_minimum.AAC.2